MWRPFVSLEDIIAKRVGKRNIGFGAKIEEHDTDKKKKRDWLLSQLTTDDLVQYGMIPEFVGRLPVLTALQELDCGSTCSNSGKPKNALLKQYQKLFRYNNAKLEFTDGAIREIAKKALKSDTGARALRSVVEELMLVCQYNLEDGDGKTFLVDEDVIAGKKPLLPLKSAA